MESDDYFVTDANLRYTHPETGMFANLKISNIFNQDIWYPATENADFSEGLLDEGTSFLATVGWKF